MSTYLDQVSIFESTLALLLILGINWAFTLVHILQEWKGEEVPLWRVFGAVVGLRLPDALGFLSFTVGLCLLQWLVGLMAIAGWLPIVGPVPLWLGIGALGAVIGARLGDNVVSHWGLTGLGYRPNPGLSSTVLYTIEAVFLLWSFRKGLALDPRAAWIGSVLGAGFFVIVLPTLKLLRVVIVPWQREPWVRGQPIPAWAKEP